MRVQKIFSYKLFITKVTFNFSTLMYYKSVIFQRLIVNKTLIALTAFKSKTLMMSTNMSF